MGTAGPRTGCDEVRILRGQGGDHGVGSPWFLDVGSSPLVAPGTLLLARLPGTLLGHLGWVRSRFPVGGAARGG